jgi:hypothetical protein
MLTLTVRWWRFACGFSKECSQWNTTIYSLCHQFSAKRLSLTDIHKPSSNSASLANILGILSPNPKKPTKTSFLKNENALSDAS